MMLLVYQNHLLKNLFNAPTIRDLSRMVALNESKLKNGFRRLTEIPYTSLCRIIVWTMPCTLLDAGKVRVNEVADRIGYGKRSHFIAAFRKKFGITPKQYLLKKRGV